MFQLPTDAEIDQVFNNPADNIQASLDCPTPLMNTSIALSDAHGSALGQYDYYEVRIAHVATI